MTRTIEVSHWGNIAVEETYVVRNTGSKLLGSFSRLDFDMGIGRKLAVTDILTNLPGAAKDIYYRDEIGNISTSTIRETSDSIQVKFTPRFPLLGGWKTQYTIGYNVPSYEFLHNQGRHYSLRMRLLDHVYDDQYIEKLRVKIILPEHITNIKFRPPFPVSESREIIKTYLDISGRPVIVAEASNLVIEHIENFSLDYQFNRLSMLREPFMLVAAFAIIFVFTMVYVRLDFSISTDEKADLRLQAQAMVDDLGGLYQKRSSLYRAYEDLLATFKSGKDAVKLTDERRRLEAQHKQLNQSISQIQSKMSNLYTDGADKVGELATLDQRYRDLVQESIGQAERLVSGKLSKTEYQVADNANSGKKSELLSRMDYIVEAL